MPIQFYNLPWHMYHAEQATYVQSLTNAQVQTHAAAAASQGVDQGKQEQNLQTQATQESQDLPIQSEDRGAHSHTLPQRKEKKKEEKEEQQEIAPPDPSGRGRRLDIRL